MFNYKNVIELWVMKTENSQKVFSVSITHYFSHYLGVPRLSRCSFFFSFSKYPQPEPSEKKKKKTSEEERKKNPMKTEPVKKKRKKKKKTRWRPNQWERRRKKKVNWSKGAAEWVPHMCLITKILLSYELWKLKTSNGVFSFHNS